ncbi:MAG TPA: BON domain-containing protein [Terracidiphilus sp.]|nr:BON domain-containing protein [Terracidiphilus sp.]
MKGPKPRKYVPFALATIALFTLCGAKAMQQSTDASQADSQSPTGQRSDGQIEMDVVHALDASDALKNDLITAATVQGEVTLSGTVSSQASKQLAESIAGHVQGVTKVQNNLKVGNVQEAANEANEATPPEEPEDNQAQAPQSAPPDNSQPAPPDYSQPAPQDYPQPAPPSQAQAPPPPPARSPYGAPYPYPPPPYPYGPPNGYAPPPPPRQPRYATATGPITVPEGTVVQLRTSEPVDSKRAKDGTPVEFTVIRDVAVGGVLAIPRGATMHGVVTQTKNSGPVGGSPELSLRLTSLDLGGQNYPIESDQFKVRGPNKAGYTAGNTIGGALLGAIIGGAVGRGEGAAIGAGAGAAAGLGASAATPGPRAWIPAEALVTFHIGAPVTVQPVSQQEADRLAEGLYPGGPSLYRRGPYGYPYYPYGYPPVYYRPYFVSGGFYYWR